MPVTIHRAQGSVVDEPPTLEVRWVRPGGLDARMTEWFGRFPTTFESRDDDYLVGPDLGELSVKIRAGRALEVKVRGGQLGVLEIPGRARGVMEFWQKWSFPLSSMCRADESSSWQPMHKLRRMTFFSVEAERLSTGVGPPASGAGCAVELTEVTMLGRKWWTLGLEATGPASSLRDIVESTAAHVFAQSPGFELTLAESGSYSTWLRGLVDVR